MVALVHSRRKCVHFTRFFLVAAVAAFCRFLQQAELAEASRLADQRIHLARTLQQELQRLRPRVCELVASLTGAYDSQNLAPQHERESGGGRSGHGEDSGGSEAEALSETLRRVAERRVAARVGGGNNVNVSSVMESRLGSATSLAARAQHQYALLAQEMADEALLGAARSTSMGRSVAGQPPAAVGSGSGSAALDAAAAAGQDGLRSSLDEPCNRHDELGAIGRGLPPDSGVGADNINSFVASIQMRRADDEARLNLATAAMADADDQIGGAERRMRRAAPFIPKTRRLVADGVSSGAGEENEAEDDPKSSAAAAAAAAGTSRAPTTAPGAAAGASASTASAAARDRRNPYARVGDYLQQRRPRRQMRGDEEVLLAASAQAAANSARWERQPKDYIPVRRRHPAPAPAPAGALLFPPSSHSRAGGAGQPPSIPPTVFRFVRNSPSASPPAAAAQAGLPAGPVSGGAARRGRPGNRRSSNSRAEEAERALRQSRDDGSDPFFSSLPHLPPLTYQTRGGGGDGTPAPAGAAAAAVSSSLVGVSSADPDQNKKDGARSSGHPTAAPSSGYPAKLADLIQLYCNRCRDTSSRLRAAVSDREALFASTLAYLRGGGGLGGAGGAGGGGGSARGRAPGTAAAAAPAGVGAFGWRTERGYSGWGGDGEYPRAAGAQGQGCCAKCSEEVRACVIHNGSERFGKSNCLEIDQDDGNGFGAVILTVFFFRDLPAKSTLHACYTCSNDTSLLAA